MDPFHVVRVAGDALDKCRRRIQQAIHGHGGRKNDPLYAARRTLHTGADLLTDRQKERLTALFVDEAHAEVEATWGIYQRMIEAYREKDRSRGRELMVKLIDSVSSGVPKALVELVTLGRTLKKRAADVLAYFDRPGTSNGPTEAINGRLGSNTSPMSLSVEPTPPRPSHLGSTAAGASDGRVACGISTLSDIGHLRGSALGFRNLTNYIARSLLETGGFRPQLHPRS
jgi:transposase